MALRGTQAVKRSFLQVACLPACSRELSKASQAPLRGKGLRPSSPRTPTKDDKVQTLYTNSDEASYVMGMECKLSAMLKDEFKDFAPVNLVPATHANPILFLSKNPVASVLDRLLHGLYYPSMKRRHIESAFQTACHRVAQLLELRREECALVEPSFAALFSGAGALSQPAVFFPIPNSQCALA